MLDDFFSEHQKILSELLKTQGAIDEKLEKRIRSFLIRIDGAIEAYVHSIDQFRYTVKKLDGKLEELSSLKSLITNQRSRLHGSGNKDSE